MPHKGKEKVSLKKSDCFMTGKRVRLMLISS